MTDDRRFLSHACLEPKVERDQDGLHLIIPYRNKTSLGLAFSPTVRNSVLVIRTLDFEMDSQEVFGDLQAKTID